ncbi:Leucine-rich repeat-containing N-terminal, plant-type [Sesbania bispinosa]|nr:Leucine-rich repeat-containing N-terminal, plant-type [Sesbania bispinosa]
MAFLLFMSFLTLSSLMSICPLSEAYHGVDKEALLQYKCKIDSDPSKQLHSWLASSDCSHDWEGVACNYFKGTVVNLTLTIPLTNKVTPSETYTSGTFSPYLGNLSHLQVMDLSYLLSKLFKLEMLYLDNNHLSDNVPSSVFASMKSLTELDL